MQWIDVCGPPGVGKSTLCDSLWPPRAIQWKGETARPEWGPFLACVKRLMEQIEGHQSYAACASMMDRTLKKMAAVSRRNADECYVQTAFAQRGLGIGWRLGRVEEIAEYFWLMPVSVGVAILSADVETICRRNRERGKDRSFMVPGMERPREIAVEVLRERGVRMIEIDTREDIEANVARLELFAGSPALAALT